MVAHRLSCFSNIFLLANSTCWLLIFFYILANSTCWPFLFFTGQLNVLAYLSFSFFTGFFYQPTQCVGLFMITARWISSALVTRSPTCSGNTPWGVGHWQRQETWHRPIPRACMHSQAKPDQSCTARAKLETTCHIFYLWFPMVTLPPRLGLQPGILSAWPFVVCTSNFSIVFLNPLQWSKSQLCKIFDVVAHQGCILFSR